MKLNKFSRNSAIVTALLASLCCITPVLAVLGGLSSIVSTFSFLEPFRPYFIAITILILGFAFYNAYKPKKKNDIDCACEDETSDKKVSFINSKKFLWIITAVSTLLITFPYYSKALFPSGKGNVSIVQSNNIVKAKLTIEGMSCISCEKSVDYALKSEIGVISATSSYKTGIVYVEYDNTKVNLEQLKNAVEEKVGYKVKNIEQTKK
ncbi:MAG: mercuric transport protein MerTP [Melioribacter sp.]|uniref:mercuric transport protein MerTP n=1 Tax=Rosettibacter primus TaxID=3111523 RepID=UPI00247C902E|nr:mercuric transport protein MerTP [Melioribacter sp.]